MQQLENRQIHVQKSKASLVVTQAILGFLTIAFGFASLEQPSFLLPASIAGVFQAYSYLWFDRLSLLLDGNILRYSSLLGGTKNVRIEEIRRFEIQVGEKTYGDKFRPPIRLEIEPYPSSGESPFDINMKFFELNSLSQFVAQVDGIRHGQRQQAT